MRARHGVIPWLKKIFTHKMPSLPELIQVEISEIELYSFEGPLDLANRLSDAGIPMEAGFLKSGHLVVVRDLRNQTYIYKWANDQKNT